MLPRDAEAAWRDVQAATERVLPFYDRVSLVNTFGRIPLWRARLARTAGPEDVVLEIGSGPGSFARLLPAHRVYCLDPSETMLGAARRRLRGTAYRFVEGVAEGLPFRTASLDRVYCSFSFRQFPDKPGAIREMARVLRPGGELHILDAARPPPGLRRAFMDSWLTIGVPAVVTALVPRRVRRGWTEQPFAAFVRSYAAMESPQAYARHLEAAGLDPVRITYLSMRTVFHLRGVKPRST
ncbi:MAG TPA: methyltransferase domain-containing protein [Thermoplasmata archaeon]|jgi:demethylmenaquinone methyltransferase/2-methoxy-6-polyprenyl-1,4-benzoquinol methylase|nr:methyltransferase domain-containing protein [Thermoplasmata archaeon]